jgi:PAS domain S-box-containing protein
MHLTVSAIYRSRLRNWRRACRKAMLREVRGAINNSVENNPEHSNTICGKIIEIMPEAAFAVSFRGTILFCNSQFGRLVKRPAEQIVGQPLRSLVTDYCAANSLLLASSTRTAEQRIVFQAADGTTLPAHAVGSLLHLPDRKIICVVASDLTEIEKTEEQIRAVQFQEQALQIANEELTTTEEELRTQNDELLQSRAELERARYQYLFEMVPEGYILADPAGVIQECNLATARLVGWERSRLEGNSLTSLFPSVDTTRIMSDLGAQKDFTTRWEAQIRPPNRQPFWAEFTTAATRDPSGNIVNLRFLIRDITEHKRALEELCMTQ